MLKTKAAGMGGDKGGAAAGVPLWILLATAPLIFHCGGCTMFPAANGSGRFPAAANRSGALPSSMPDGMTVRYQNTGLPGESSGGETSATSAGSPTPERPQIGGFGTEEESAAVDSEQQQFLVRDVQIRGNDAIPTHHLMRHVKTRAGRFFDPDRLQQDVDALWKLPEIRRVNGPYLEKTPEGVNVAIEVVERRLIDEVKFVGNRALADWQLRKRADLKPGQPLDVHEVQLARQRLQDFYDQKGFTNTQVEVAEGGQVEDRQVVFLVHEGTRQRVWRTEFVGNEIATDARLRHFVKSKPGIAWLLGGELVRDQLEQDLTRLTAYYRSLGFFNARIGRELMEDESGWVTVRFIIDEGPRYKVRSVSFVGNQKYLGEDLLTLCKLKPGDEMPAFNAARMDADVNALRDMYGSQGYVFADVIAEPRFLEEPGMLDLVYRVNEGQQYRVGRINVHIDGDYGVTKREVVLNRLGLKSGDLIDVREIRAAERRLGGAQIFADGASSPGPPPRVVVRPPELQELQQMAEQGGASRYR